MEKLSRIISILLVSLILSSFLVNALEIRSVEIQPNNVQPNSKISINLQIKNNFDTKITNIVLKMDLLNKELPFAPLDSGTERIVDSLKKDEEAQVSFNILVSSEALTKLYKIPLKIMYTNQDKIITNDDIISIDVQSKPSIKVALEENALIKGTTQDLNFNIINDGVANIKFLNVKVDETNLYNLISQNSFYIGNLDSDDTQTVNLKLFVKDTGNSELKIPIKLSYKDTNNKDYFEERELVLKIYSNQEAQDLGLIKIQDYSKVFFGVIAFFVVVLFIFYRRKK